MRSIKLTSAVLAAAALLALAPPERRPLTTTATTPSSTRRTPGDCQVTLNVAPAPGHERRNGPRLGLGTCGGAPAAGQTVTLYERAAGSPGFSVAGTTTTDQRRRLPADDAAADQQLRLLRRDRREPQPRPRRSKSPPR